MIHVTYLKQFEMIHLSNIIVSANVVIQCQVGVIRGYCEGQFLPRCETQFIGSSVAVGVRQA